MGKIRKKVIYKKKRGRHRELTENEVNATGTKPFGIYNPSNTSVRLRRYWSKSRDLVV